MAINASIPLGVQPLQIENPVNQLAKVLQIKDMQQGQQMNALKMDEYRRSVEDGNALRSALSAPDADPYKVLLQRGRVKEATDFLKGQKDAEKTGAETEYKKIEAAHKRVDLMGQSLGWLRQNPSVENAQMLAQYWTTNGVADPQKVQAMLAEVQANPTPQAIAQFADMGFRAALSTKEQLPKLQTNNVGGSTVTQQFDPVSGKVLGQSAIQNTQSPDAILSAQTSEANNRRSVGAQYANADATRSVAQATRDAANIQRGFESEQGLRKEFEALPEVKKYKQALPSYKGIEDAVKRNTTQADINIVYGIAKLYDPDSVVREGEYATVANSPNIPERIKGYAQYLAGGGKLTAQVKSEMLAEAQSRIRSYETEFLNARGNFENIARRTNVEPTRVFPSPATPAIDQSVVSSKREARGKVGQGPSVFDQADAILRGGR